MKEGTYIRFWPWKELSFTYISKNGRAKCYYATNASAERLAKVVNKAVEEGLGYITVTAQTWEFRHRPQHIMCRPPVVRLAGTASELLDELEAHNGQKSEALLDAAARLDNLLGELYGKGEAS